MRDALRIGAIAGAAAFGAGAGGLGAEVLLLSGAGVALGFDRAAAWGLALWLAAWSIGAWCAGRRRASVRADLVRVGFVACAAPALALLLAARAAGAGGALALAGAVVALAVAALPQGAVLPLFARACGERRAALALLFAANLAGCVAGAQWLGFALPARHGRLAAAVCAGVVTAASAWIAAAASPRGSPGASGARGARGAGSAIAARSVPAELASAATTILRAHSVRGERALDGALPLRRAGLVLACATAWIAGLEWIGLRLAVLWLGGMQHALGAVLAASLVALAAGAALLAPFLPARRTSLALVLALGLAGTLWPFALPHVRLLAELRGDFARALVIVGPALAPFGALLPLLHRSVRGESGRRLGDLLVYEALGALVGLPLLHELCAARFGLDGALAALALCGGGAALALAGRGALGGGLALASVAAAAFAWRAESPAASAPALTDPAFRRIFFAEDECFAVSVVDDAIRLERTLLTDDFRATATGPVYLYMHALGHLPLLLHPAPRSVGVLALGTGTTASAVALHPEVERIHVLEISRRVCEALRLFEPSARGGFADALARAASGGDERVTLHIGDGRRTLGALEGELDVLTMEPLLPDSPYGVHLYTPEFYARARAALAPGGLVCQWVPTHAMPSEVFDAVVDAFARSFEWSGLFLYGAQLVLVGGSARPEIDPARFPPQGSELFGTLAALGLQDPAGVLARFATDGARWPRSPRALRDLDPWILYRSRARSGEGFDRAANLATIRALAMDPLAAWPLALAPEARESVAAHRTLHRAQEAWARRLAEWRHLALPDEPALEPFETLRAELEAPLERDPEARAFLGEVRVEELRLEGVLALARADSGSALRAFLAARDLAGDRADLHLFVAAALEQSGEERAAAAALRRAQELCPRVLETPQAATARSLAGRGSLLGAPAAR